MLPRATVPVLLALALTHFAGCAGGAVRHPVECRHGTVPSSDSVPIHYLEGGRGETALVFVHGWLGNASWWQPTMQHFAPRYRVVAVDLAGHGASGTGRADWTVERFADDVAAVVRELGLEHVVLLGHSMSGAITVEAARRLGARVHLLVPIDTLNDLDWDLPPDVWARFFADLRADFPATVEDFFRQRLFLPRSPPEVATQVVAEARVGPPERSVRMLELNHSYDLRTAVASLDVPIHALNSDRDETKVATNRRYARRFEVTILHGTGHWPMLEDPPGFAAALEAVLAAGLD
ncbi:MAG: alpha/beta hydrolase [Planctomycetota bacterium]